LPETAGGRRPFRYTCAMTTRRRLLLFALPTVAMLPVGVWLLQPRTAITPENAAKIQVGMTLRKVEAILSGPARREARGRPEGPVGDAVEMRAKRLIQVQQGMLAGSADRWISSELMVWVIFDFDGRVVAWDALPVRHGPEGLLDMLRRWLRL